MLCKLCPDDAMQPDARLHCCAGCLSLPHVIHAAVALVAMAVLVIMSVAMVR